MSGGAGRQADNQRRVVRGGTSSAGARPLGSRLVISGYYGFGNLGDEAVLAGILHGLRAVAPQVVPMVLSAAPAATSREHGVLAVDRRRPQAVWRALGTAAGLLSGGGSLLQDVTSRRSVYYYLGVLAMAWLRRRPYCLYGQGIGPLQAPPARLATALALRRSRGVWVRDEASRAYVGRLFTGSAGGAESEMAAEGRGRRCTGEESGQNGAEEQGKGRAEERGAHRTGEELGQRPAPPVHVASDPAFLLPAVGAAKAAAEWEAVLGPQDAAEPRWLVAVRPWQSNAWLPAFCSGLLAAARQAQAALGFIPMHFAQDTELAAYLAQQAQVAGLRTGIFTMDEVQAARRLIAGAHLVVAMRLHALILAAAAGVPGVAVSYDPKVTALAEELPLPWLPWEKLAAPAGAKELAAAILNAWQRRAELSTHLLAQAQLRRQTALAGLAAAIAALELPVEAAYRGDG